MKGCSEVLICSAHEQSIRTNYIKYNIDKTGKSPLCIVAVVFIISSIIINIIIIIISKEKFEQFH